MDEKNPISDPERENIEEMGKSVKRVAEEALKRLSIDGYVLQGSFTTAETEDATHINMVVLESSLGEVMIIREIRFKGDRSIIKRHGSTDILSFKSRIMVPSVGQAASLYAFTLPSRVGMLSDFEAGTKHPFPDKFISPPALVADSICEAIRTWPNK